MFDKTMRGHTGTNLQKLSLFERFLVQTFFEICFLEVA